MAHSHHMRWATVLEVCNGTLQPASRWTTYVVLRLRQFDSPDPIENFMSMLHCYPWDLFTMWRYTFFASTLALASLLGALLGDYLFHYTMEAIGVKTFPRFGLCTDELVIPRAALLSTAGRLQLSKHEQLSGLHLKSRNSCSSEALSILNVPYTMCDWSIPVDEIKVVHWCLEIVQSRYSSSSAIWYMMYWISHKPQRSAKMPHFFGHWQWGNIRKWGLIYI